MMLLFFRLEKLVGRIRPRYFVTNLKVCPPESSHRGRGLFACRISLQRSFGHVPEGPIPECQSQNVGRRKFIKSSAAAGIGFWVAGGIAAKESNAANERIRFACIGIGGKGSSDSADAARFGDVVA